MAAAQSDDTASQEQLQPAKRPEAAVPHPKAHEHHGPIPLSPEHGQHLDRFWWQRASAQSSAEADEVAGVASVDAFWGAAAAPAEQRDDQAELQGFWGSASVSEQLEEIDTAPAAEFWESHSEARPGAAADDVNEASSAPFWGDHAPEAAPSDAEVEAAATQLWADVGDPPVDMRAEARAQRRRVHARSSRASAAAPAAPGTAAEASMPAQAMQDAASAAVNDTPAAAGAAGPPEGKTQLVQDTTGAGAEDQMSLAERIVFAQRAAQADAECSDAASGVARAQDAPVVREHAEMEGELPAHAASADLSTEEHFGEMMSDEELDVADDYSSDMPPDPSSQAVVEAALQELRQREWDRDDAEERQARRARNRALWLTSLRLYTAAQLRDKLLEKDFPADVVATVIADLQVQLRLRYRVLPFTLRPLTLLPLSRSGRSAADADLSQRQL